MVYELKNSLCLIIKYVVDFLYLLTTKKLNYFLITLNYFFEIINYFLAFYLFLLVQTCDVDRVCKRRGGESSSSTQTKARVPQRIRGSRKRPVKRLPLKLENGPSQGAVLQRILKSRKQRARRAAENSTNGVKGSPTSPTDKTVAVYKVQST